LDAARRALAGFSVSQRRELAVFLDAPSDARADLIRQSFERGHVGLGEMFIDLEADPRAAGFVRLAIESLEP
jgi:hypothetical protein